MTSKNGHKTAKQEICDYAIAYVQSNEELTKHVVRTGILDWRTVRVPHVAHMTVVWAGYTDEAVLLHINVSDSFAKRLTREFIDESGKEDKGRSEEG